MKDIDLVKKFKPIFIFSKDEDFYPVTKKFLTNNSYEKNNWSLKNEAYQDLPFPEESLYYDIVLKKEDYLIVNFILLFPTSEKNRIFPNFKKVDISSILVKIDRRTKTLEEIKYNDNEIEKFSLKTTRPIVYIKRNSHTFSSKLEKDKIGLRWEPSKVFKFNTRNMENVKIKNKLALTEIEYVNIKND